MATALASPSAIAIKAETRNVAAMARARTRLAARGLAPLPSGVRS